jgi:hypothetical protein
VVSREFQTSLEVVKPIVIERASSVREESRRLMTS